jgi:hypothetical protein
MNPPIDPRSNRPHKTTRIRVVVALVVLAVLTGITAEAEEPNTLFIETITVTGLRNVSREVVVSESLLREGESYTEEQLRQAVFRINRLPFVLETSFSLRKGTKRGTHKLVIEVKETLRFFFGLEMPMVITDLPFSIEPELIQPPLRRSEFDEDAEGLLLAGYRFFIGSRGVLFAALDTTTEGIEVGYTQYDLFGANAFLNVGISHGIGNDSWGSDLEFGLPVKGNHSLRLLWSGRQEDWTSQSSRSRDWERHLAFRWHSDTRNDILFATRGALITAGIEYFDSRYRFRDLPHEFNDAQPEIRFQRDEDLLAAVFTAQKFHQINSRSSWSFGGRAAVGRAHYWVTEDSWWSQYLPNDVNQQIFEADANIGYLHTLWRPAASRQLNDLRWRTNLSLYGGHSQYDKFTTNDSIGRLSLTTSLAWRSRWGVLRFAVSYRKFLGDTDGHREWSGALR